MKGVELEESGLGTPERKPTHATDCAIWAGNINNSDSSIYAECEIRIDKPVPFQVFRLIKITRMYHKFEEGCVLIGFDVVSTIFPTYHDSVWLGQGAQFQTVTLETDSNISFVISP